MSLTDRLIGAAENGRLPDWAVRTGIRRLLRKRLAKISQGNCETQQQQTAKLIDQFSLGPIAPLPEKANEQHYEVGSEIFRYMLGKRFKYSCCFWDEHTQDLNQAEENALRITCERAGIQDGMEILELGCGWGSLSLWMAEHYPESRITAVSNSSSQRDFILKLAQSKGIGKNLNIVTCDMNDYRTREKVDRVLSVEMFEHMRNYRVLLNSIGSWLRPEGKLFVHIFCNRDFTYEFHDQSDDDWMSRYFFSGGIMPSDDLLLRFQEDLTVAHQWRWSGEHYQRTADAWIACMDQNRPAIIQELMNHYGGDEAKKWFHRWRMFYMSCSELFGFQNGQQWWVSHYLFNNNGVEDRRVETSTDHKYAGGN